MLNVYTETVCSCVRAGVAYFARLTDTGLMGQKTIKPDKRLSRLENHSIKTQLGNDWGNKNMVALGPDLDDGSDGHC